MQASRWIIVVGSSSLGGVGEIEGLESAGTW
jgi:hypothetical protein